MSVENVIHKLVSEYTDGIAAAMRQRMHAVIDGIFEDAPESPKRVSSTPSRLPRRAAKGGRLKRRSIAEIDGLAGSVAALLADKGAMRAEQIRTALGLEVREMPRIMKRGLANGVIAVLSGQKRATTYGLPGGKSKASKKPVKKMSKKPARKPTKKK